MIAVDLELGGAKMENETDSQVIGADIIYGQRFMRAVDIFYGIEF